MNITELRQQVAEAADLSNTDATKAVDAVLETIAASLEKGDAVTLTGFGTFEVRDRDARTGRNPQTGEAIQIAASKSPAFKAGAPLRRRVSGK